MARRNLTKWCRLQQSLRDAFENVRAPAKQPERLLDSSLGMPMTRPIRVLMPEDSENDARLLLRQLGKLGYSPTHRRVEDRLGMKQALEAESWDIILSDYSMPQFNAVDGLRLVQELGLDIPFIIISGSVGEDVAVQAMKAGAHDYLMKGQLSRLGEAIERELTQAQIRKERKKGLAELEHLNHVLRAVRGINRLIVQEKDPEKLLQRSAELLVATRGYQNATFIRTDGGEPVLPVVAVLGGQPTQSFAPQSLCELPACLQIATLAERPVVVEEDKEECAACQFRDLHWGRTRLTGLMRHQEKSFGVVVISLPRALSIQEAEQELFEEMIGDVAFALHGIELAEDERRTRERFQRLYENMAQGVVYQDATGQITRCNPAAERVLGLTLSQMQGRSSMDPSWRAVREDGSAYPGEEHPSMLALRTGKPARGVMGVFNPSESSHRWLSISAVPEFETPGEGPSGVFATFEDITGIRNAEAQLREAQAIAGLGRWELDLRDNRLYWSDSIYELFELDAASFEATYEAFLGFVHPEDRQALDAAYRRSVESREPYTLTHRLRMPDGRIKWVKEMGRTSYTDDGTPLRSVGTVQDVTDLKTAEAGIEEGERRYRALFEGAPIGIFSTTSDGKVLSINPAMGQMLGFPSVEATLAYYHDLGEQLYLKPERRSEFVRKLEAEGRVTDFEYEARSREGAVLWLSMSARVAKRREDGSFVIDGFTTEITQRKLIEFELARSESLLNLTGSIAKVGGWEFDLSTMRPYLSEETLRIYELPLDHELPVEEGVEYYHPEDRPKLREAFERALERGEPYDLEVRFISAKGTPKWVQTICRPHYQDGKLSKLYGTIQDISERKQQDLEKQRLEEQYHQAQKMESVGRLAGGVAHDFNNHLTVINSYASFVAEALRQGDPLLEDLEQIQAAGKRAANLTRQLLAFSRKQVLEPKLLDLNEVIVDLEKMLMRLIGEDIEIQTVLAEGLGNVFADPGQLEQVLMNLAVNARDAMPNGGKLSIETAAVELDEDYASKHPGVHAGPHVMLAVSDDGEGMSPETQARLFEPFYTTKEKGRGTGLGLATVYGIVQQSGGSIWVYSERGQGTTFKLYFPRVEGEKAEAKPGSRHSRLRGDETVLVVEDEDAVRMLAERILQSAGYQVIAAANAGEALLECEKRGEHIKLVLTDVIMPKLSGRELADRLKLMCPGLQVLFMSGYTDNAIVHHGVLDAGTQFIAKPFNTQDLLRKVRETLELAAQRESST